MFKINDGTESWGRFNPNSYIVHPSDANLTPVNLFLEAATPTGRTITSWDVDLQNDITASPFKNRGRLMDYIGVANTADDASVLADIDRLIANLEVRNNYMHLISTIYTVKDWATNPLKTNDPNYFQHDMDKDGVYESHAVLDYLNRSLIVIHRDTFTDSITILDRIPIYED